MNIVLRLAALILLLGNIGFVLYHLPQLPETIPTHFGANGEIDGWGSKYSIIAPVGIQSGICLLLMFLARHPEMHNYMAPITEANKKRMYAASSAMLEKLNVAVGIIFVTISYSIVNQSLPIWVIIFELIALFGLIIFHVIQSKKTS